MKTSLSVLLIDDNNIDNYVSERMLKRVGISSVVSFATTNKAFSYLLNTSKIPDIIFIVHMPTIDGFDVYRKINKLNIATEKTKFFILSCSINPEDKLRSKKLHLDFIEKPLTEEKIIPYL